MTTFKARILHPWTWVHGLLAAFIGGVANTVSAMVVAPESFNLGEGLSKVGQLAVVSGVISAALYLKQAPLPGIKEDTEWIEHNGPDSGEKKP